MFRSTGTGLVGLDIGTTGIRGAQLSVNKSDRRYTVERIADVPLRHGMVEGGEIADVPGVTRALKDLWKQGRFSSRKVAIGLPDRNLLTRQVDLPWMPPEDFRTALRYQVGDALPVDLSQVELDYHVLGELNRTDERGQVLEMNRTLVVAADTQRVIEWSQCARKAGLEPVTVDSPAFALIRGVSGGRLIRNLTVNAIVDIGAEQMTIVIYRDGQPLFVRSLANVGGDIATARVAEALGISFLEAEELKRATGLSGPAPDIAPVSESSVFAALAPASPMQRDPRSDAVMAILNPWATNVVGEIRNSLEYFRKSFPDATISSLTFVGRTVLLSGLLERVATQISVPTKVASPLLGLPSSTRARDRAIDSRFASAIGLAMGADL